MVRRFLLGCKTMSDGNPFSDQYPYHQPPSIPPKSAGVDRFGLIMAVITGCFILACCGLGTTGYFAFQKVGFGNAEVALPSRGDASSGDEAKFNQSLASLKESPNSDPELGEFIETSAQAAMDYEDIPFSASMFAEAVAASESATDIGPVERFLIVSEIGVSPPVPYVDQVYYRILDVRVDGILAEVDLVFYHDAEVVSHQWFLVKEADGWKLYDWQILERGRRLSDEYAAYYSDETFEDDGYDTAINLMNEAEGEWYIDETSASSKLRRAESTKMRPVDRPVALLQIAQAWMRLGKYEEGLRVLEKIPSSERLWGVWPGKAACHLELGNLEAAIEAISQVERQSPQHPCLYALQVKLYDQQGKAEEATDARAAYLRVCRKDERVLLELIAARRPKDIPLVVDLQLATLREAANDSVDGLLGWTSEPADWSQALVAEFERRKDDEDFPPGLLELIAAEQADHKEDREQAAVMFVKAQQVATDSRIKDAALRRHADLRLAHDSVDQLLAETPDLESTLRLLCADHDEHDDDMFATLLPSLEQQQRTGPWYDCAVGCGQHRVGQFEQAVDKLDAFLKTRQDDSETDDDITDHAKSLFVNAVVQLGQPMDVVTQWPDDVYMHTMLTYELLWHWDTRVLAAFVNSTADNPTESVVSTRLMVEAELAARAGDVEAASAKQRIALERQISNEHENRYYFDPETIALRWGEMLARSSLDLATVDLEIEGDDEHEYFNQVVTSGARASSRLGDEVRLNQWLERVEQVGFEGSRAAVLKSLADLQGRRGNHQAAAATLAKAVELSDDDDEFRLYRLNQWFNESLLAGDFETAAQVEDDPHTIFPRAATIELARGEFEQLKQRFADSTATEVADWLAGEDHVNWLIRHGNEPGVTQLLADYPLDLDVFYAQETGLLVYTSSAKIDQQRLTQILAAAFPDDSFTLTTVLNTAKAGRLTSWQATSADGQRIVISLRADNFTASCSLPDQVREQASEGVQCLEFGILDFQPDPDRRLFAIAAQAAGDDAFVFSWGYEHHWIGPDLKSKLTWSEIAPLKHSSQISCLDLQGYETQELKYAAHWDQQRKSAAQPIEVVISCENGVFGEQLTGELIKVDEDDGLHVRLKVDSQCNPLCKRDVAYRCYGASEVQP
jgi:tetratricopeptide (TPR) repeat protein